MKIVSLVSGGKDSIISATLCARYGHEIVCIANVMPSQKEVQELDSYSFQTVGHQAVEHLAECLNVPLRRAFIDAGQALTQEMTYEETTGDEVETLFQLLQAVVKEFPDVKGVSSGAIMSRYQGNRVEHVCRRLGLISLAPMWQLTGFEVLELLKQFNMDSRLIKTAAMGLDPRKHLGKSLQELAPFLKQLAKTGAHPAGEGGEYETLTLDSPLFAEKKMRFVAGSTSVKVVDDDPISPTGHLLFEVEVVEKTPEEKAKAKMLLEQICGEPLWKIPPLLALQEDKQARKPKQMSGEEDNSDDEAERETAAAEAHVAEVEQEPISLGRQCPFRVPVPAPPPQQQQLPPPVEFSEWSFRCAIDATEFLADAAEALRKHIGKQQLLKMCFFSVSVPSLTPQVEDLVAQGLLQAVGATNKASADMPFATAISERSWESGVITVVGLELKQAAKLTPLAIRSVSHCGRYVAPPLLAGVGCCIVIPQQNGDDEDEDQKVGDVACTSGHTAQVPMTLQLPTTSIPVDGVKGGEKEKQEEITLAQFCGEFAGCAHNALVAVEQLVGAKRSDSGTHSRFDVASLAALDAIFYVADSVKHLAPLIPQLWSVSFGAATPSSLHTSFASALPGGALLQLVVRRWPKEASSPFLKPETVAH